MTRFIKYYFKPNDSRMSNQVETTVNQPHLHNPTIAILIHY